MKNLVPKYIFGRVLKSVLGASFVFALFGASFAADTDRRREITQLDVENDGRRVDDLKQKLESLEQEKAQLSEWMDDSSHRFDDGVLQQINSVLPQGTRGCDACRDCVVKALSSNVFDGDINNKGKFEKVYEDSSTESCPVVFEVFKERGDLVDSAPLSACKDMVLQCPSVRRQRILELAQKRRKDLDKEIRRTESEIENAERKLAKSAENCADCQQAIAGQNWKMTSNGPVRNRDLTIGEKIIMGLQIASPVVQGVLGIVGTQMGIDSYNTLYNQYFDQCKAIATMPCAAPGIWAGGQVSAVNFPGVATFGANNWGWGGAGLLGNSFGQMGLQLNSGLPFGAPTFGMNGFTPWGNLFGANASLYGSLGGSPFGFPGALGTASLGGSFPFFGANGFGGGWGNGPFGSSFGGVGSMGPYGNLSFGTFGAPYGNWFGGPNTFGFPGMGNGGAFGGLGGWGSLGTLGSYNPALSSSYMQQNQALLQAQWMQQQIQYSKAMQSQSSIYQAYQQLMEAQSRMSQTLQMQQQISATGGLIFQ